jgi:hypothetical protein
MVKPQIWRIVGMSGLIDGEDEGIQHPYFGLDSNSSPVQVTAGISIEEMTLQNLVLVLKNTLHILSVLPYVTIM